MKTDALIDTLSADLMPQRRADAVLPWAVVAATIVFGGAFLAIAGIRPDLSTALAQFNVLLKQIVPPFVSVAGLGLTLRLSQPGARTGSWPWLLAAAPLAVLAAMVYTMAILPMEFWPVAARGHSRATCLSMIPLISAPVLAASLVALRRGAPTRPGLCGAAAGLTSATAATTAYAFFCTDDSPLFYGIWYTLAILAVVLAGYLLGRRTLRW
jgi:hypothetical protein